MPNGPNSGKSLVLMAGELADAIELYGGQRGDIEQARACYDSLLAIAESHGQSADVRDRLICGALRLTACHAQRGDVAAIRAMQEHLKSYGAKFPGDPAVRRGYCEIAVTLSLECAKLGDQVGADAAFAEIQAMASSHPTDRVLRSTLAKAIANRIAFRCNENRTAEARHLHTILCGLAEITNSLPETMLHRAYGTFNLVTHIGATSPQDALTLYADLAAFVDRKGPAPALELVLADAAFALITIFGDASDLAPAARLYGDLAQRVARSPDQADLRHKAAVSGYNLMTDYCRLGDMASARQLYDDILALSISHPDDEGIALVLAKACVNGMVTAERLGDHAHAELLCQELNALVASRPDDEALWAIAASPDEDD